MNHGDFVLNLLKDVPKDERIIVLIRHSKRDSFKGIPDHLREGVEITPDGIHMARMFGESMGRILPGKCLHLGHTVARRCRMTAESIAAGYSSAGSIRMLGCQPVVENVVVNPDNYITLREEFGWSRIMQKWLNQEIPDHTLKNAFIYSDNLLKRLVSFSELNGTDPLIVIAHDVTILPVLFSVFGKTISAIEFLNGVVITGQQDKFEIRYSDADFSLKKGWTNI